MVVIGAQAIMGPMKFALSLAANGVMNLAAGEKIEEYKSKAAFNLTVFLTGRNTKEEIEALDESNERAKSEHAKGNRDYPLDGDGRVVASRFLIDAVLGEFKSIGVKAGGRILAIRDRSGESQGGSGGKATVNTVPKLSQSQERAVRKIR